MSKTVFAIAAHPDDIEFMMAGTLLLLKNAGCDIHYMNIGTGSCGTNQYDVETIVKMRREESMAAAARIGAVYHESLVNDLEIFYNMELLTQLASIIRKVEPDIVLTHRPNEYMEDHSNTCRLAVTAAFARGMTNFPVAPACQVTDKQVTIYHGLPYGLKDPLRNDVLPEMFVDVESVQDLKREILACHKSQKDWLDQSQGLDSYLNTLTEMDRQVGRMSGEFTYAEGWTRHLHLGLCGPEDNPLHEILKEKVIFQ